jgi:hypothetical protein
MESVTMQKLPEQRHQKFLVFTKVSAAVRDQLDQTAKAEGLPRAAVVRRAILRDLKSSAMTGADQ